MVSNLLPNQSLCAPEKNLLEDKIKENVSGWTDGLFLTHNAPVNAIETDSK